MILIFEQKTLYTENKILTRIYQHIPLLVVQIQKNTYFCAHFYFYVLRCKKRTMFRDTLQIINLTFQKVVCAFFLEEDRYETSNWKIWNYMLKVFFWESLNPMVGLVFWALFYINCSFFETVFGSPRFQSEGTLTLKPWYNFPISYLNSVKNIC